MPSGLGIGCAPAAFAGASVAASPDATEPVFAVVSSVAATDELALVSPLVAWVAPLALAFSRASHAAESPPVCHMASAITATITAATPHSHDRRLGELPSGTETRPRGKPAPDDAGNDKFCSTGPLA